MRKKLPRLSLLLQFQEPCLSCGAPCSKLHLPECEGDLERHRRLVSPFLFRQVGPKARHGLGGRAPFGPRALQERVGENALGEEAELLRYSPRFGASGFGACKVSCQVAARRSNVSNPDRPGIALSSSWRVLGKALQPLARAVLVAEELAATASPAAARA